MSDESVKEIIKDIVKEIEIIESYIRDNHMSNTQKMSLIGKINGMRKSIDIIKYGRN